VGEIVVNFDGRSITYGFGELDMLVPAYAATIHKSQGSEYPAVIIPVLIRVTPSSALSFMHSTTSASFTRMKTDRLWLRCVTEWKSAPPHQIDAFITRLL
jgi:hypothetical protein